ncbi:MAG: hypothetical protein WCC64_20540 [Aliidongia sp.]|jgi:hypothetical protein
MSATPVSFAADILGMLYKYRGQMMWRLDLANYDDVKANAAIIYSMIELPSPQMPPEPFPPFSETFVATFKAWMDQDYPP